MPASKKGSATGVDVSVEEVVAYLRVEGGYAAAAAKVAERKAAAEAARAARIRVTAKELQAAADGFRALRDLGKASDTNKWMKANGITVEELEGYLETNILMAKLRDSLAKKAPKRLGTSKAVKNLIRELAYQEWLASALK